MKVALVLSYLGTRYHGWQRQKNALTVQQLLEDAARAIDGGHVYVSGCGRTDAGVHARYYVASCELRNDIPLDRLPHALNANLPADVAVHSAHAVPDSFDARFSCVSKEYTYVIHNTRVRDPFCTDRAWVYPRALDERAMRQAALQLIGTHDFAALRSVGTRNRTSVRTIYYCDVERQGERVLVRVCADGFLYNMVRAIAGTLVYCGIGKIAPDEITQLLRGLRRGDMGPTAPACGLYMTALTYGMEELDGKVRWS